MQFTLLFIFVLQNHQYSIANVFSGTDNSLRADAGSDVEINGTNVPVVLCGNNSTGNNIARYQWQSLNDFLDIDAMVSWLYIYRGVTES